jgi:hypothetical protein
LWLSHVPPIAFIKEIDEVRAFKNRGKVLDTLGPAVIPKDYQLGFPTEPVQSLTDLLHSGKLA